jgi:Trp operon repressor
MTEDERTLLLYVAQAVAEDLDHKASQRNTTNNLAANMHRLIQAIRDRQRQPS